MRRMHGSIKRPVWLNVCVSPTPEKPYGEALVTNVISIRRWGLWKLNGFEEVPRVGPSKWD